MMLVASRRVARVGQIGGLVSGWDGGAVQLVAAASEQANKQAGIRSSLAVADKIALRVIVRSHTDAGALARPVNGRPQFDNQSPTGFPNAHSHSAGISSMRARRASVVFAFALTLRRPCAAERVEDSAVDRGTGG
jgi:hypothetical protein